MTIKIGILSDSHKKTGRMQKAINHLLGLGVDYFVHAGDIVTEENLKLLENTKKPYFAVYGNNDSSLTALTGYNIFLEPYYFNIEDKKIKLMHLPFYLNGDADVIIYGHTHIYEVECKNGIMYINPGEVCARDANQSTWIMLEIEDKKMTTFKYSRIIGEKEIVCEQNIFMCN